MNNELYESIRNIKLEKSDLDKKIEDYINIGSRIVFNKRELVSFLRGEIKKNLANKFKNKESIEYLCLNNLTENILFTIDYECLYFLESGLNEAFNSRMRMVFEQVNDIVLLNYYAEEDYEDKLGIVDLYYINYICKSIKVMPPKCNSDNEFIECKIKDFDNGKNSDELIKQIKLEMKSCLETKGMQQNDFWFYRYTNEKNKLNVCKKIIKEKLENYIEQESTLNDGQKEYIKNNLHELYNLYEMNKHIGNFFVHGNLSAATYETYGKSLEKKDITCVKSSLIRIDVLLFILVICVFENDKEFKNSMEIYIRMFLKIIF